jgi:hypothetical protein
MKQFFLALFIFSAGICSAQSIDTIVVHRDPRIDVLAEKQIAINKVASKMSSNGLFRGYRLQVLNTRSRDDAFKTKAMLLENFPDEKVYVLYQSPYFKVRIGNFITRGDAEDFKNQLSAYYSQPVYVIEDLIEYIPKADDFQ